MKKIICALIFCSFALIAAAQKFDVMKVRYGSPDDIQLTTPNRKDILYNRYKTRELGACISSREIVEKLNKTLFDRVVTPQIKKIVQQEYPKLGAKKCWLVVDLVFERATGKIADVAFILPADFLKVLGEEHLKEMYRKLMTSKIDTTGIKYHPRQKYIATMEFTDFLKFALEEK